MNTRRPAPPLAAADAECRTLVSASRPPRLGTALLTPCQCPPPRAPGAGQPSSRRQGGLLLPGWTPLRWASRGDLAAWRGDVRLPESLADPDLIDSVAGTGPDCPQYSSGRSILVDGRSPEAC
jgi:hypothetical protein